VNHCSDKTREQLYGSMKAALNSWLVPLCKTHVMVNTIHFAAVFVQIEDRCPICARHPDLPILLLGDL
jgi:hypothetical protein